jgi:phosphohistidine phosphatase
MELLIVRHAIACERDAERWPDDRERPLSARGVLRARQAARGVRKLVRRPVSVLSSPLLRAQQTAAILSEYAGWPRASLSPLLAPEASPAAVLALLARSHESRVALVGHQPGLGRLLVSCLPAARGAAAFEMRKMGIAVVGFDGAARSGRGTLRMLVPPRLLRAVR